MKRFVIFLSFALAVCSGQECQAGPISIVVTNFTNSDKGLTNAQFTADKALFNAAITTWQNALGNPNGKTVTVTIATVDFKSLAIGNGGVTIGASAAGNGLPGNVTEMDISTNTDMFYGAGAPDATHKSASSVMLHELGHAVGFNYLGGGDGYQKWNDRITGTKFDMFGTPVTLASTKSDDPNGLSHIATSYAANDLMNLTVGYGPGSVRGISQLDLCMLAAAYGYQVNDVSSCPEPGSFTLLAFGIAGMTGYGWRRRKQVAAA